MKKAVLTLAIVLGMTLGAVAQKQGGGLFGLGDQRNGYMTEQQDFYRDGSLLNLPNTHGNTNDTPAPLGTGALLLIGFGAAYALRKKQQRMN